MLNSNPAPEFVVLYIREVSGRPEVGSEAEMLREFLHATAGPPGRSPLKRVVSSTVGLVERHYIEAALETVGGKRTAAARILGVSRRGFYDKLARYHIDARSEKPQLSGNGSSE